MQEIFFFNIFSIAVLGVHCGIYESSYIKLKLQIIDYYVLCVW
jgi:hypothetical protein